MKILILALFIIFIPSYSLSHSGGTDSLGCHNNSKTGNYHCHSIKSDRKKIKKDNFSRRNQKYRFSGHFCRVTKVIDGDTVVCDGTKIRLLGIEAAELNTGYYAKKSKDYLTSRIMGKKVFISYERNKPTYGYYGRLLGTVIYNGSNINNELLKRGYVFPD